MHEDRGCPWVAIGEDGSVLGSGWPDRGVAPVVRELARLAAGVPRLVVGIDAPQVALRRPRAWYWTGSGWRPRRAGDRGSGRHAEVVVSALGLARPQWAPCRRPYPGWMVVGYGLHRALAKLGEVHEVFPSAAHTQLARDPAVVVSVPTTHLASGPKDMLDAAVAAFTIREYAQGRGDEVGGGDGYGTIVLPRPVDRTSEVHRWPGAPLGA